MKGINKKWLNILIFRINYIFKASKIEENNLYSPIQFGVRRLNWAAFRPHLWNSGHGWQCRSNTNDLIHLQQAALPFYLDPTPRPVTTFFFFSLCYASTLLPLLQCCFKLRFARSFLSSHHSTFFLCFFFSFFIWTLLLSTQTPPTSLLQLLPC